MIRICDAGGMSLLEKLTGSKDAAQNVITLHLRKLQGKRLDTCVNSQGALEIGNNSLTSGTQLKNQDKV